MMPKVNIKDIIMFLKMFGISSLFFISGIIIRFLRPTHLNIKWPAYVIISAMLIGAGIIILIIETIKYIKTHNKKQIKDITDILKKEETN